MQYKKIELELPPLGEVLVTTNDYGNPNIGYFYLRANNRQFYCMWNFEGVYNETDLSVAPTRWAKLPKFKSLKKERPPLGVDVILSTKSKIGRDYTNGVNLKDYVLEDRVASKNGLIITIDSWIEIDELYEDD